ncbi:MAG TPA: FAD-dependent oxidoreductase [Chthoniobacterales bacterium]|nr:FAD-dependent oxidoreductase [Chthoniobacterales bacterium]
MFVFDKHELHRGIRITGEFEQQQEIEADYVALAMGACPDYVGSQNSRIINSDELLERIHPPAHLSIVSGGYVGCEFAAIYRGFGCQVTLAEKGNDYLRTAMKVLELTLLSNLLLTERSRFWAGNFSSTIYRWKEGGQSLPRPMEPRFRRIWSWLPRASPQGGLAVLQGASKAALFVFHQRAVN